MIERSTDIRAALRSRQRGFLLNPFRFGGGGGGGGSDPFFSSVQFLSHMDGANGSTTLLDAVGPSITITGGGSISTADSVFGGACLDYPAYTSSPTVTSTLAKYALTGDFTVELFVKFPSFRAGYTFLANSVSNFFAFRQRSAGLALIFNGNLRNIDNVMIAYTWHHVALTRASNVVRTFVDGGLVDTATISGNQTTGKFEFCGLTGVDGGFVRMDEFRFTSGVARYTANFTPPTAAFPDS